MADFTGNVYSNVLGMNTAVRIITSKRRNHNGPFRAVYLLHGLSDNSTDWSAEHPLLSVGSGL